MKKVLSFCLILNFYIFVFADECSNLYRACQDEAQCNKSECYLRLAADQFWKDRECAFSICLEGVKDNPDNADEYHLTLARMHSYRGMFEKACEEYELIRNIYLVELDVVDGLYLFRFYLENERYDQAIRVLEFIVMQWSWNMIHRVRLA